MVNIEKNRNWLILLIILIGAILRLSGQANQDFIIGPHDTFASATGSLELKNGLGYNYSYLSPPGVAILLFPFFLIFNGYLAVKIALLFYSLLLILLTYFLVRMIYSTKSIPALI